MKIKKLYRQLWVAFFLIIMNTSCSVFARDNVPYVINGTFVSESNIAEYEICGVDIYFLNKSDKVVNSFTVVFFLFDEEGEPVNTTKSNLVFRINESVESKESINLCLSLDQYMNYYPEEDYFIDYLYVSNISYTDGTEWSDPLGLQVF